MAERLTQVKGRRQRNKLAPPAANARRQSNVQKFFASFFQKRSLLFLNKKKQKNLFN